MTRIKRFHVTNYPYFVTSATLGRLAIFADLAAASHLRDVLYETRTRYKFLLLGFVIMPDHLHAVVVPRPGDKISQVMRFIKGTFARRYNESRNATGPVWQPSFYDRVVRDERGLMEVLTYVTGNPVRAGLCSDPSEYRFSSAHAACPTDLAAYLGLGQAEGLAYG
ncbi:MAG: transposase [Dehalococcoidia bacterium]|nr:transposase [Dehalococcoidia bacterium]